MGVFTGLIPAGLSAGKLHFPGRKGARVPRLHEVLADRLAISEQMMSAHSQRHDELVHDAMNITAALRMALVAMMDRRGSLTRDERGSLGEAIVNEIGHLEHLIDRPSNPESVDFDIEEVIRPVVELQRAHGLNVSLQVAGVRARGCPADLATVIQNLLVNARMHAGDSGVTIRATVTGQRTEIFVEDLGPGISRQAADRVLDRGEGREGSPGLGLGLHICRTLMDEQGGELEILERPGRGAVFLLSLPSSKPREVPRTREFNLTDSPASSDNPMLDSVA